MVKGINGYAHLVARLILGVIFVMHGWQKVFDVGVEQVARDFDAAGVPWPDLVGQYSAWVELIGGVAVAIGLALPVACVLLIVDLGIEIYFIRFDAGFWDYAGGYEFQLALIAALAAVCFAQAGTLAVDHFVYSKIKS
ncbi:DoxX family membrane protein [Gordonia amarae]|uniref:DoxX family protein n=2 Tax=Gordonia amarae TaxID=36821 RepID=G7GIP4_9ACTN|nr:DoxX family protein [Gordonia amarae]MCS3880893.1 putative oxidoreductase [Gordonia amarae]QHN19151.1 DoxX family membrane protein [Gordonia amarae]QHN23627.1 DoxX family membrane protein [Gordonia amarae]QHN32537.1 DoxX family membrane protein [Gordonia amarae]QHN41286.1 DoxX family membrane protein [Gordonia amarae]